MRHASVTTAKMRSPLNEAMRVNPKGGGRSKRGLVIALSLTSLVDAFSIMLLYLLTQNTGNGSTVELAKTEKLPAAVKTSALSAGTLVRIEGNKYFIGEQPVEQVRLAQALQEKKFKLGTAADADALIIQADKTSDFAMLAPVIRAGSISGFNKFKFAVIQEESAM